MSDYRSLITHYESCLLKHGDNFKGMDWPSAESARKRYEVMLGVIQSTGDHPSLLDFGCGASHLFDYIREKGISVRYSGLDLSEKMIEISRMKFPENTYLCQDILRDPEIPEFDYIVLNGVFTEKLKMSQTEMTGFMHRLLKAVFSRAKRGIAFNVMSKLVAWERDDLFHVGFDELTRFVHSELSRYFVVRQDYGLFEYTVYVYREPN